MKALLLAAGLGTRLKPFTFFQAKATIPLFNLPFIHFPLQYLESSGIQEVVINLHSHPESVKSAVASFGGPMKIHYSFEPEILGTAGAIRKAAGLLGEESFVVMNGDLIADIPLSKVLAAHKEHDALITMVIMPAEPRYSSVYFSEENPPRFLGVQDGKGKKYHYTGLQILNPEIYSYIPENKKSEIFRDIYPSLLQHKKILGYIYEGLWKEIGNLKEYLNTSLYFLKHSVPQHLQPPKMQYSLVASSAVIEPDANVSDSIIMDGSRIRSGSVVHNSIVGRDLTVSGKYTNQALARGMLPWYL